jgi:hypothetical protein
VIAGTSSTTSKSTRKENNSRHQKEHRKNKEERQARAIPPKARGASPPPPIPVFEKSSAPCYFPLPLLSPPPPPAKQLILLLVWTPPQTPIKNSTLARFFFVSSLTPKSAPKAPLPPHSLSLGKPHTTTGSPFFPPHLLPRAPNATQSGLTGFPTAPPLFRRPQANRRALSPVLVSKPGRKKKIKTSKRV